MPVKILTLAFDAAEARFDDTPLTGFLANKHVRRLVPRFFELDGNAYWSVLIEYNPILDDPPVNSREEAALSPEQRRLMDRLREWRKETAEADGVLVFIVGTNRQLVDIVRQAPTTLQALADIPGFGKKKVSRYGKAIIERVRAFHAPDAPAAEPS